MRIEFGFQANCSELVTHLGFTKREDIVKALAEIARVTGWNWWVHVWGNPGQNLPLQVPQLDGVLSLDASHMGVEGARILELWGDRLDEKAKKTILDDADRVKFHNDDYLEFAKKNKMPAEEIAGHLLNERLYPLELVGGQDRAGLPRDPFYFRLGADISCNCPRKGLVLRTRDYSMEPLPAFHAVRIAFQSDLDDCHGGHIGDYLDWMIYHFIDKQRAIDRIDGEEQEEDRMEKLEGLERYPPLDKTKGLPQKDKEMVLDLLR
jgi:hypothetical protein